MPSGTTIDTADEKDWEQALADLGDLISDAEWDNVVGDFDEIDTNDYWEDDVEVDLDDIDFADNVDLDDNTFRSRRRDRPGRGL